MLRFGKIQFAFNIIILLQIVSVKNERCIQRTDSEKRFMKKQDKDVNITTF